jgi:hypothetical protein
MPRISKRPLLFLALSPAAVANALCIRDDEVNAGIKSDALPVHVIGIKRRILVADVEAWVRSWPAPSKRKPRRVPDHG